MDKIEIYMCPVCGETEKHPKERTYGLNLSHRHIDDDTRQEYHVQFDMVLEIDEDNLIGW